MSLTISKLGFRLNRLLRGRMLRTPAGKTRLVMPRPGNFSSFYAFAVHKSGSTLMNSMLIRALDHAGIPHVAISETAFSAGLPENEVTNPEEFIFPRGYCYRGFREFPPYLRRFDISKNKKVLLVRDPRDMLVSDYFSTKHSHPLPVQGIVREQLLELRDFANSASIDEYCLAQTPLYQAEYEGYGHIAGTELRTYRYEDVIFRKFAWLDDMLSYFEIAVPKALSARIAEEHDIRPETEQPSEHIRQVTPGNFRRHLSESTIESLNRAFSDVLARYGYQP